MGGVVSPAFPPPSHRCPPLRARSGAAGLGVRGTGSRRFYSPSGRGGRSRGASGGSSRRALPERSGRGWERKINHPRGRASAGSEGVQLPAAPAKSRAGRQGPSVPRPRPRPGPRRSARCAPIQMCTHPPRCARARPGSWGTWQGCWRLSIAFMSLSSSWLSCSSSRSSSTWVGRRGEAGTARTPRPRAPAPGPPAATPSPPPARGVSPRWTEPLLAAMWPGAAKGEGLVRGAPTSTRLCQGCGGCLPAPAPRISPVRSQKCCRAPWCHRCHPSWSCGEPGGAQHPAAPRPVGTRCGRVPGCHLNATLCRAHQSSPLGMRGGLAGPFLCGSGWGEGPSFPVGQRWGSQSGSAGMEEVVSGCCARSCRAAAPGLTWQLAVDLPEHAAVPVAGPVDTLRGHGGG